MKQCYWPYCEYLVLRVHNEGNSLLNVYSCDIHTTYYCTICNARIAIRLAETDTAQNTINVHFMTYHTFRVSTRNYLYHSKDGECLVGSSYHNNKKNAEYVYCFMSDILKTNPYFIYLIPEFSISDILDQFDEGKVPGWRLLAAIIHKPFSCLICGGLFESFPSNEVFAAHKCKK